MSKYKKIQREKLSEKGKSIYDKLKKVSNNFENTEGKIGEALDKFYDKVEKSAVEQPKAEPKKAPAKKKPAAKKTSKAKKNAGRPKSKKKAKPKRASYRNGNMGTYAKLAAKIRDEEGISYREAQKKASKIYADMRGEREDKRKSKFEAEISHFKKKYKGKGTRATTINKDAQIPAKAVGKRISKEGNVYYEYRDNRTDQKQPQPSKYPRLAKGGTTKGQTLAENFNLKDEVQNVEFWKNDVIVKDKKGKIKRIDLDKGERISLNAKGGKVKRDWSNYYEFGGDIVASYDVAAPFGTYAKGGTIMSKSMQDRLIDKNGERKIDRESIKVLTNYVNSLEQTKDMHQNNGVYTDSRKQLHKDIIAKFKDGVVCINNNKPIAILMGGSPASGKSTFLRKYAPYLLKDEILRIDADEVRSMLPEYEGWNASQTHLETKDIVNTLLSDRTIGLPCETDIIYDGTMNSNKSYLPLIKVLRKLGYKIFIVYIDKVPKDVIVDRALKRYGKSGRFVPLEVIDDFFDKGKDALNEIKNKVDGYMIIDGSSGDYKVIEEGGMKLPKTRKYGQIGTPMKKKKKLEFGGDITQNFDVRSPLGTYAKGGKLSKKFSDYLQSDSGEIYLEWYESSIKDSRGFYDDGTLQFKEFKTIEDAEKFYKNNLDLNYKKSYAKGGKVEEKYEKFKHELITRIQEDIDKSKERADAHKQVVSSINIPINIRKENKEALAFEKGHQNALTTTLFDINELDYNFYNKYAKGGEVGYAKGGKVSDNNGLLDLCFD